jgi:hypothetical protein
MHHGVKLWNGAPQRVKDAKIKFVAKRAIEEYTTVVAYRYVITNS